jgi:hypothetical protein
MKWLIYGAINEKGGEIGVSSAVTQRLLQHSLPTFTQKYTQSLILYCCRWWIGCELPTVVLSVANFERKKT